MNDPEKVKKPKPESLSREIAHMNLEIARKNLELARKNMEIAKPHVKAGAEALRNTMVTFAGVHVLLVIGGAIYSHNPQVLNLFTVIGLDRVWPELGYGTANDILSAVVAVTAYLIYFLILQVRLRRNLR
jgi:hypothetical protein